MNDEQNAIMGLCRALLKPMTDEYVKQIKRKFMRKHGYKTLDPAIDAKAAAHFKLVFGGEA